MAASDWLMGHLDDPDINEPLNLGGGDGNAAGGSAIDPQKIGDLFVLRRKFRQPGCEALVLQQPDACAWYSFL